MSDADKAMENTPWNSLRLRLFYKYVFNFIEIAFAFTKKSLTMDPGMVLVHLFVRRAECGVVL